MRYDYEIFNYFIFTTILFEMPVREGRAKLWFKTKEERVIINSLRMNMMISSSPTSNSQLVKRVTITTALCLSDKKKRLSSL